MTVSALVFWILASSTVACVVAFGMWFRCSGKHAELLEACYDDRGRFDELNREYLEHATHWGVVYGCLERVSLCQYDPAYDADNKPRHGFVRVTMPTKLWQEVHRLGTNVADDDVGMTRADMKATHAPE